MANPPFNVDMVDPQKVKGDPRLFTEKKIPGISAKTKTVSNANYLWIQYFYAYLNKKGRAGFVMAQSATDAGHGEKTIREQIIVTGDVDIIVSIGTNFFYTRSLPCSLRRQINEVQKLTVRAIDHARKELSATKSVDWVNKDIKKHSDVLEAARHEAREAVRAVTYPFAQVTWLQTRFPDARMADVLGLCKVVTRDEIAEQDHSLTPGCYVGVAPPEPEDEEHVEERLREIHVELSSLNKEAVNLAKTITTNFEVLVG